MTHPTDPIRAVLAAQPPEPAEGPSDKDTPEAFLQRQAGIVLGELRAARELALRMGHEPNDVAPPYLLMLQLLYQGTKNGTPRPVPIAVAERLPRPGDCGVSPVGINDCCWTYYPPDNSAGTGWWALEPIDWAENATHWLPHDALPLPEATP